MSIPPPPHPHGWEIDTNEAAAFEEDTFITDLRKAMAKPLVELSAADKEATVVVPDYLEALVGWRSWNYDGGILCSVTNFYTWIPSVRMTAECLMARGHQSPDEGCACGVYAVDRPGRVYPGVVVGKVALWGKVIPGTTGWRAQYAYPMELWTTDPVAAVRLRRLYGVPVHHGKPPERLSVRRALASRWLVWGGVLVNALNAVNLAWHENWGLLPLSVIAAGGLAYLAAR